jgi:hypothetical protein
MRQVGVLCAAAYVAVRDTVGKLADDHRKAKALAGFIFLYFFLFKSNFTSFCYSQFTSPEQPCFDTHKKTSVVGTQDFHPI